MKNKSTSEEMHSLVSVIARGLGVTGSDDTPKFLEAIAMQLGMTPYGHGATLKDEVQQINENLSDIAGQLGRLADILSQSSGDMHTPDGKGQEDEILNRTQVARLLGRSVSDVYHYWKSGALKRHEGTRWYHIDDVRDFIKNHRVNTVNGYYYSLGKPRD